MKQRKPLRSKKPLKRNKPLPRMSAERARRFREAGKVASSTLDKPDDHAKAATRKAKRPTNTGFDAATVDAILERDGHACGRCGGALWGERGLDFSIQHRRARGAGGTLRPDTNAPQNGLALCGHGTAGCHGYVESQRTEAEERGWAISQEDDPLLKPVDHALHGWIYLYPNGSWGSRPWREEACA